MGCVFSTKNEKKEGGVNSSTTLSVVPSTNGESAPDDYEYGFYISYHQQNDIIKDKMRLLKLSFEAFLNSREGFTTQQQQEVRNRCWKYSTKVFLDVDELNDITEFPKHCKRSKAVLLILTENTVKRAAVWFEIMIALNQKPPIPVVPVVLKDVPGMFNYEESIKFLRDPGVLQKLLEDSRNRKNIDIMESILDTQLTNESVDLISGYFERNIVTRFEYSTSRYDDHYLFEKICKFAVAAGSQEAAKRKLSVIRKSVEKPKELEQRRKDEEELERIEKERQELRERQEREKKQKDEEEAEIARKIEEDKKKRREKNRPFDQEVDPADKVRALTVKEYEDQKKRLQNAREERKKREEELERRKRDIEMRILFGLGGDEFGRDGPEEYPENGSIGAQDAIIRDMIMSRSNSKGLGQALVMDRSREPIEEVPGAPPRRLWHHPSCLLRRFKVVGRTRRFCDVCRKNLTLGEKFLHCGRHDFDVCRDCENLDKGQAYDSYGFRVSDFEYSGLQPSIFGTRV